MNAYFVEHIQRVASVLFYVSYLGRALLVKVDNFDLGKLAEYALNAGFDWVWYKSSDYLHISVIPDGMYDFFYPPEITFIILHIVNTFKIDWRFLTKFPNILHPYD